MPNLSRIRLVLTAAAFLLGVLAPQASFGQNVYGSISGIVTDASGSVIQGANVTLTRVETGEAHTTQTTGSGEYTFVNILPGNYKVEVEKTGFKKVVRESIVVQVESGLRVDIALEVGSVNQTVEVTAEAPLLQPETSSLGQVVETRSVTELPLNGRNPLALVALSAGVVPQGQPSAGNSSTGNPVGAYPFAAGDFQIGGGQAGQSQILIDGVPTNGSYLNVVTVIPTQDAIQEFKVQTNNLGPEYGRFAGGVINLTTKSGTNQFHGSFYEFIRNKVLNANDYFDNRNGILRPPFTQNQFGLNGGGPIKRDKLFFFGAYEGFRLRKGNPFETWVPTDAERSGDFSNPGTNPGGAVFNIYDPTTSANCTGSNKTPCRTQFTYNGKPNVIPPGRIDPTAAYMVKTFFPEPNITPNANGNFADSYSSGGDVNQYNGRIDFHPGQRQSVFGR